MVGRNCIDRWRGDRAMFVSVSRRRGNDRHRGWNGRPTLRMHSVATGNLLHDGVVNPTVNAAVAPDYLARVWHQRRAEITGEDDQRRPTVFLFGFMHEAVFSMFSYRTRETDMTRRGFFDESLMPRVEGATMFDLRSPHTRDG